MKLHEHEFHCRQFRRLAERVRTGGELIRAHKHYEDTYCLIEKYCVAKGLLSLSVGAVNLDGYPGDWFGKYIPVKEGFSSWKLPLVEPKERNNFDQYKRRTQVAWKSRNIEQDVADFRRWLETESRDPLPSLDLPEPQDDDVLSQHLPIDVSTKPKQQRKRWKWPRTSVSPSDGHMRDVEMWEEGLLSKLGYTVNKSTKERQQILDDIFYFPLNYLPKVNNSSEYMQQFGEAQSLKRLLKMANILATLTRNRKLKLYKAGQSPEGDPSITFWKQDLDYLRDKYLVDYFKLDPSSFLVDESDTPSENGGEHTGDKDRKPTPKPGSPKNNDTEVKLDKNKNELSVAIDARIKAEAELETEAKAHAKTKADLDTAEQKLESAESELTKTKEQRDEESHARKIAETKLKAAKSELARWRKTRLYRVWNFLSGLWKK